MRNLFTFEVSFNKVPLKPFEWEDVQILSLKVTRVSEKTITDLMTYDSNIKCENNYLLLSDTCNAVALKLGKNGNVVARSFLTFDKELDVSEFSSNLKVTNLSYETDKKRVEYPVELREERNIKNYIISNIKDMSEDKFKYIYYLYYGEVKNYSKKKLIDAIEKSISGNYYKLYDFLIKN